MQWKGAFRAEKCCWKCLNGNGLGDFREKTAKNRSGPLPFSARCCGIHVGERGSHDSAVVVALGGTDRRAGICAARRFRLSTARAKAAAPQEEMR